PRRRPRSPARRCAPAARGIAAQPPQRFQARRKKSESRRKLVLVSSQCPHHLSLRAPNKMNSPPARGCAGGSSSSPPSRRTTVAMQRDWMDGVPASPHPMPFPRAGEGNLEPPLSARERGGGKGLAGGVVGAT